MLWTSREREGRRLAESVVRHYRKLDAPTHALCMEAGQVWAQATVHLGLFELRPDISRWAEAEALLGQLAADYARSAGPHSIHGLAALVQQGLMSVYLGKPAECREILRSAEPELQARLGHRHPLLLRARYALGLAHFQLREYGPAAQVLGAVWQAQREVIGPCHPDTLHSQLQYGVAMKLADRRQSARSAQLIRDVCSSVARTMGRRNDLYGQAFVASLLPPATPAAAVQFFQDLDQILARWRKR
jgi:hypothetical protein